MKGNWFISNDMAISELEGSLRPWILRVPPLKAPWLHFIYIYFEGTLFTQPHIWIEKGPSFRKLPFYVEKRHGGKVLSRKVASLSYSNQGSSREYSPFESIKKFDYLHKWFLILLISSWTMKLPSDFGNCSPELSDCDNSILPLN